MQDAQGDTALHAASLCGHIQCVTLLLYFARSVMNKQGLSPEQLAMRAGHDQIARLVAHVEQQKQKDGLSSFQIFWCTVSSNSLLRFALD
jgi:ankyrin repeat protein